MGIVHDVLEQLLGLGAEPRNLALHQVLVRALIIFAVLLTLIRVANRRFMAGRTPIDLLLAFLLASLLSRAVNGSAPFFQSIVAAFFVVLLHRLIVWATYRSHRFGRWLKGVPTAVIGEGAVRGEVLARHRITENDLLEDMRLGASTEDVGAISKAILERNGSISFQRAPRCFEFDVAPGVRKIVIQIG